MKKSISIKCNNWVALPAASRVCILPQKSIMYLTVQEGWGINTFCRYVFHTIGVAVMVLALHSFHVIPISSGSKQGTEQSMSYSKESPDYCQSDLSIKLGYIGDDVIALCDDEEASYALHASKVGARFIIQISSTHGLISTLEFDGILGARQMVMLAMAHHLDNVRELEQSEREEAWALTTERLN